MTSTVIATVIGVGGSVIVGVAGLWATVRATGQTIQTIQADRAARLWDKQLRRTSTPWPPCTTGG
jgi:hypothetical protein